MKIGLVGCGNMARRSRAAGAAPCCAPTRRRARARRSPRRSAARRSPATPRWPSAPIWSCSATSPPSSQTWPREVGAARQGVASILAATPLAALRDAYPDRPVYRIMPSLPVEVRQGAVVPGRGPRSPDAPRSTPRCASCSPSSARWSCSPDALMDVAMGLMSCAPAYVALVAEAQVDAGVRRGIPAAQGAELVVQTLAGTAELLRRRGYDTLAVRREVASPGGLTARGAGRARARRPARRLQRRPRRGARRPDDRSLILASARTEIAGYLSTLIYVYTLLIIIYIVIQLLFSLGVRPPYSRTTDAVLGFLRDVCEPFLRIFRRIVPRFGGLDFSPMLAIIVLRDRQQRRSSDGHPRRLSRGDGLRQRPSAPGSALGCSCSSCSSLDQLTKHLVRTLDHPRRRTPLPARHAARPHPQPRRRLRLPPRRPGRRHAPDRRWRCWRCSSTSRCTPPGR